MASRVAIAAAHEPRVVRPFTWPSRRPFLTAEWRNLVMLNYEADAEALQPLVPPGTELDWWQGATYASIVGFQFLHVRLGGVAVPFHSAFEEVNLRFYVRRRTAEGWRRGVTFVRELAPRRMVALVARLCYGENYLAVPMQHRVSEAAGERPPRHVEYQWQFRRQPGRVAVETSAAAKPAESDSHEQYIIEHYWGYSAPGDGWGREYEVAHPPWQISPAAAAVFDGDAAGLYGRPIASFLTGRPASAFWADGSAVRVYRGTRIGGA